MRTVPLTASTARREVQSLHDASPTIVADLLKYDDKILARMNKLISEFPSNHENELERVRIQSLIARLAAFISDEIRCRLDRTYLEALNSSNASDVTGTVELTPHETSLRTELGTLYTEIDAVAQMFVDRTFTTPLGGAVGRKSEVREESIRSVLENVSFEDFFEIT